MKIKISFFVFLILIFLLSFFSCLNTVYSNFKFILLEVKDGHFEEDVKYTYAFDNYYEEYIYNSNGSAYYNKYSYEGTTDDLDFDGTSNEGWILTFGYRGTYDYNEELFEMTINFSQFFGDDPSTPENNFVWFDITNEDGELVSLMKANTIFFTNNFYSAYLLNSEKEYIKNELQRHPDNISFEKTYIYNFLIVNKITYTKIEFEKDANNNITHGQKYVYDYYISNSFPENEFFDNGKTITFYCNKYDYKEFTYSTVTQSWGNPIVSSTINEYKKIGAFVKSSDGKIIYQINESYARLLNLLYFP